MASTDARPIPIKNTALRITFPIYDADGDLVTGAAGLDSEVSKDGGTFADCTNEATEIATASGMYYLDLTSTEMNADTVAIIVKTSTSGAKTTAIVLYPQESGDVKVDVETIKTQAVTCAASVTVGAYVGNATAAISVDASGRLDISKMGGTSLTARDIGASVLLSSGTGTGQISLTSGAVTVGTNNDKTGYSLTQAFPTNFASLGINASGHVSRVTLVDTTTTNTDMITAAGVRTAVGLASANLDTQLSTIAGYIDTEVAAIKAKTDNLPATPASSSDCLTAAGVRSAVGLASANLDTQLGLIAGYIDTEVAAIKAKTDNLPASPAATGDIPSAATIATQVRTELATELARVDVATSTRLASSSYTAPLDAAGTRAAVGLATANLDTQLGDLPTNAELATALASADDATLAAIAALSIPTANENADAILSRNASNVEGSAGEHTLCTVILAMLEGSVSGSTWTIKRTDGSTTHATKTVTTDATANPITGVN